MKERQSAFHDLSPESFPFLVEFVRSSDGQVVHAVTVDGPGALEVPALAATSLNGPVAVRITFADGSVVDERRA